jgi:hypothetical protein
MDLAKDVLLDFGWIATVTAIKLVINAKLGVIKLENVQVVISGIAW